MCVLGYGRLGTPTRGGPLEMVHPCNIAIIPECAPICNPIPQQRPNAGPRQNPRTGPAAFPAMLNTVPSLRGATAQTAELAVAVRIGRFAAARAVADAPKTPRVQCRPRRYLLKLDNIHCYCSIVRYPGLDAAVKTISPLVYEGEAVSGTNATRIPRGCAIRFQIAGCPSYRILGPSVASCGGNCPRPANQSPTLSLRSRVGTRTRARGSSTRLETGFVYNNERTHLPMHRT